MGKIRDVFMLLAPEGSKACKCVQGGEVYLSCPFGTYKGPPEKDEAALPEGEVHTLEGREDLNLSDPGMVLPERMFLTEPQMLGGDCAKLLLSDEYALIPVSNPPEGELKGLWLVARDGDRGMWRLLRCYQVADEARAAFDALPMFPLFVQRELHEVALGCSIGVACIKLANSLVWVFKDTSSGEMLYTVPLGMDDMYGIVSIRDGDKVFVPDGWSDTKKAWKALKKKRKDKMKGLGNPIAEAAPAATPAVQAAPVEAKPVKAQDPVKEVAPVQKVEPVQEAAPATELTKSSEPVQEAKRTRVRRESKAVGIDLAKVIEEVSSPVDAIQLDGIEKVQEEIRALRDLQIAAARRVANLHAAVVKATSQAVEKWSALQALMTK